MKGTLRHQFCLAIMIAALALQTRISHSADTSSEEPAYNGRSLGSWLNDLSNTPAGPEYGPAANAIRQIGPKALPHLLAMAEQGNPRMRLALNAIHELGPSAKSAIPELRQLLKDAKTSYFAANALVYVGSVSPVVEALTDADEKIQEHAVLALGYGGSRIDTSAVVPLINRLRTALPDKRSNVVWALGKIHKLDELSVPALVVLLKDKNPWLRAHVVSALEDFDPNLTIPPLIDALSDSAPEVRARSARTLGMIGNAKKEVAGRIRGPIKTALEDTDEVVRRDARWALGALKRWEP